MVKILIIDDSPELGGGQIGLSLLVDAMCREGAHEFCAAVVNQTLSAKLRAAGCRVDLLRQQNSGLARRNNGAGLLGYWRLLVNLTRRAVEIFRLIRDHRPDLVHLNTLKSCIFCAPIAALLRIPVVWQLRDATDRQHFRTVIRWAVWALAVMSPQIIICNSTYTKNCLPRRCQRKSVVVYTPVEVDRLLKMPVTAESVSVTRIAMIGRLAPWKGQDIFLRAFSIAQSQQPTATADIMGAAMFGDDEYAQRLASLIVELELGRSVRMTGFVADVAPVLRSYDLIVHSSVLPEPMGQTIVQAMAAGVPVIATRAGGPVELIDDTVTGTLVAPGDVNDLAQALTKAFVDPSEYRARAVEAKTRVSAFAPRLAASRTYAVYESAVKSRIAGRAASQKLSLGDSP